MLVVRGENCKNIEQALEKEWLEANSLGANAYNNIYCFNRRKEHSLLTIPFHNSKLTLVSSLIEKVTIDKKIYYTSPYQAEENFANLEKYYQDYHPNFVFNFHGQKIIRSLLLLNDKNTLIIRYKSPETNNSEIQLEVQPLISLKEYNRTANFEKGHDYKIVKEESYVKYIDEEDIDLFFYYDNCTYTESQDFIEADLKKDHEKYLIPGTFTFQLKADAECFFVISTDRIREDDIREIFYAEIERRTKLIDDLKIHNELYKSIVTNTHFYIYHKDNHYLIKNSLIHPEISFQTMINSIKILYTIKRIDIIKEILKYLVNNIHNGVIPEKWDDNEKEFMYDSIDNSLWYILALYQFIEYTGDWKFVKDFLWDKVRHIFIQYHNSEIFNITIDFDGLILLNTETAINKNKLIEYTSGKNISLNILWYNTVKILEIFAAKFADIELHSKTSELTYNIRKHFYIKFWNKEKNYLNNCVDIPPMNQADTIFRPHQIFALSFPFDDLLYPKNKHQVLDSIKQWLLNPYGLLNYSDSINEKPQKGTDKKPMEVIYPYLLFHYLTAYLKMNNYSKSAKKDIKYMMMDFEKKIKGNIIGFFPQFFHTGEAFHADGILDYSLSLAEYIKVRDTELNSF